MSQAPQLYNSPESSRPEQIKPNAGADRLPSVAGQQAGQMMVSREGHQSLIAGGKAEAKSGQQFVSQHFGTPTFVDSLFRGPSTAASGGERAGQIHPTSLANRPSPQVAKGAESVNQRSGQITDRVTKEHLIQWGLTKKTERSATNKIELTKTQNREQTTTHKVEPVVANKTERPAAYKPEQTVAHKPEQIIAHKPEQIIAHKPEQTIAHKPEQIIAHKPEQTVAHKLEQPAARKPEQTVARKPEQTVARKPEQTIAHKLEQTVARKPEQSPEREREQSAGRKTERSTERKPEQAAALKTEQSAGSKTGQNKREGRDGKEVKSNVAARESSFQQSRDLTKKNDERAVKGERTTESSKTRAKSEKEDEAELLAQHQERGATHQDDGARGSVSTIANPQPVVSRLNEGSSSQLHARHSLDNHLGKIASINGDHIGHHNVHQIANHSAQKAGHEMSQSGNNGGERQHLGWQNESVKAIANNKTSMEQKDTAARNQDNNQPIEDRSQFNLEDQNRNNQQALTVGHTPENQQAETKQVSINQQSEMIKQEITAKEIKPGQTNSIESSINFSKRVEIIRGDSHNSSDLSLKDSSISNSSTPNQSPVALTASGTKSGNNDPVINNGQHSTGISGPGNQPGPSNSSLPVQGNVGTGKASSGQDPTQNHNPSGVGHDPNGNLPPGVSINVTGHDPSNSSQGHDPNQTAILNNQTGPSSCNQDPSAGSGHNGQTNTNCSPAQGQANEGKPCPSVGLSGGVVNLSYSSEHSSEERPVRFLSHLLSEMGNSAGPLANIWGPVSQFSPADHGHRGLGDVGSNNVSSNFTQTDTNSISDLNHSTAINNEVSNDSVTVGQPSYAIDQRTISVIGSGIGSSLISDVSNINRLPVIQTTTAGSTIHSAVTEAIGNESAGVGNYVTGNVSPDTNSILPAHSASVTVVGQTGQDTNTLISQAYDTVPPYLASDPYNNSNNNGFSNYAPEHIYQVNDPVPVDRSVNSIASSEPLPNHDQLVSGAEHNHSGLGPHKDRQQIDSSDFQPRPDINDPWLNHDARAQNSKPDQELQQRLDQIFNGWQDPYNNSKKAQSNGAQRVQRKPSDKSEGLIGQLITMVNDLNKNKKQKQAQAPKIYVVQKGDTLESVAFETLRDAKLGLLIYLINKGNLIKDLSIDWQNIKLLEGMVLYLPSDEEVINFRSNAPRGAGKRDNAGTLWYFDQQYIKGIEDRRRNVERLLGPLGLPANSKYDRETGRQLVTVRLGDTLRSIALKHPGLNDVSLWKLIARCNNLPTHVDSKGVPRVVLIRGTLLQIPGEEEIAAYRSSQAAIVRAESPRKAISEEVLSECES